MFVCSVCIYIYLVGMAPVKGWYILFFYRSSYILSLGESMFLMFYA